jgi:hypothetical protein
MGRQEEGILPYDMPTPRQLAVALGNQGLSEEADHFAYRALLLQRTVWHLQRKPFLGKTLSIWYTSARSCKLRSSSRD